MTEKVVIFQEISNFWYFAVKYFLWKGYDIFVFNFNFNLKKTKWLKTLINGKKIKIIYVEPATKEHGVAIEETDTIYEKFKENRVIKCINRFNKSGKQNTFLQKILVTELFEFFYINSYFQNLLAHKNNERYEFVPGNYYEAKKLIGKYGSPFNKLDSSSLTPPIIKFVAFIKNRIRIAIYYTGAIVYSFAKLYQIFESNNIRKQYVEDKRFKYAFPIDFPHQIMEYGDRGFDMLLDNKRINYKNTLFLIGCDLTEEHYRYLDAKSYNYFNIHMHGRKVDKKLMQDFHEIGKSLIKCIFQLAVSFTTYTFLLRAYIVYIKYYIVWNHIWSNCKFDNYIYSNKEGAIQILINNFLSEKKCTTWNFQPFIGGGYTSSRNRDFNNCRHILWSFLNSNYFLGISKYQIDYHQLHKQKVDQYLNIGYLYSEIVSNKSGSIDRISFFKKTFQRCPLEESKILTIFDTTFVDFDNAPTTYEDCIKFYEDILKLLHSNDNWYFIIKPSKNESWYTDPDSAFCSVDKGEKIVHLINNLKKECRVLWIANSESILSFEYNSLAIAVSDLIITHCMSSPTAEALGARKRAIWYENGDNRKGILYDKIHGLVIHGYENLVKRVNQLLYSTSHEEYENYLNSRIKGLIEAKLDGKALTRFRIYLDQN